MRQIIAIGLSPNTKKEDVNTACKLLCTPWKWIQGGAEKKLELWFEKYFSIANAISFINARSALYAILYCLNVGKDDEVILQAFTCVVVPNAVVALGAKPIYVDINNDLTMDIKDVEKKISKKTKAIIVQHTFGIPSNIEEILQIAKKNSIVVIEDVAHNIGGEYKGKKLGTFGIASVFSFGRDKAFSSVFGGMAITSDKTLAAKLHNFQKQKNYPSYVWVFLQLLYPIICDFILSFYNTFSLGKVIHAMLRKTKYFTYEYPATPQERNGIFKQANIKKFPNALACLALLQVERTTEYNKKRIETSERYRKICEQLSIDYLQTKDTPYMRFPIFVDNKKEMKKYFAEQQIYIGDWYMQAIDPIDTNLHNVFYEKGLCPVSEKKAQRIINLPTYPTMTEKDIKKVISVLGKYITYD